VPKRFRLFLYVGIAAVGVLGLIFPNKHPHFGWQKIPFYDAVFGFAGSIAIIIFSKWLGHKWLMKDPDYYD